MTVVAANAGPGPWPAPGPRPGPGPGPAADRRRPLVVEVKRNSLDDGPGIRTTVFLKGCPLACVWCHNPEAISPHPEIMRVEAECLRCGACLEVCPNGAVRWGTGSPFTPGSPAVPPSPVVDRARCRVCGRCVEACPGRGVKLVGTYYEPEELAELAALDLPFFRNSGGGVTLSGGEATLYPRYLERFLAALTERGVRVLLETCGFWSWPVFERRVLPYLDTVYFDVKLADPAAHRRYTGRDNAVILDNLRRLAVLAGSGGEGRPKLLPRVPLIPGITATGENLGAIAVLLRQMGLGRVALLPYNPLWNTKAEGVGRTLAYHHSQWMPEEDRHRCAAAFAGFDVA